MIVLLCYSKNFRKMLNKVGDSRHPYFCPTFKLRTLSILTIIFVVGICKNTFLKRQTYRHEEYIVVARS